MIAPMGNMKVRRLLIMMTGKMAVDLNKRNRPSGACIRRAEKGSEYHLERVAVEGLADHIDRYWHLKSRNHF